MQVKIYSNKPSPYWVLQFPAFGSLTLSVEQGALCCLAVSEFPLFSVVSTCRVLETHLRVVNAFPGEWLGALRYFTGTPDLRLVAGERFSPVGDIAALTASRGRIFYLRSRIPLILSGFSCPYPSLILLRKSEGDARIDDARIGKEELMLPAPQSGITLELQPTAEALIVQLQMPDMACRGECDVAQSYPLKEMLSRYCEQARFFDSHAQTCRVTDVLLRGIQGLWLNQALQDGVPATLELDHRVVKAIQMMRDRNDWSFNLRELASQVGASERNLFYLMKTHTGISPYRFYQRSKLLRVRRALLSCPSDQASISWHAANEGFAHLGRFAAIYRDLFGELPSETLAWRKELRRYCQLLKPEGALV